MKLAELSPYSTAVQQPSLAQLCDAIRDSYVPLSNTVTDVKGARP